VKLWTVFNQFRREYGGDFCENGDENSRSLEKGSTTDEQSTQ
jgi:hypothetical protein